MELLERTPHLTKLKGWLSRAEAGQGSLVLVRGEAGVGKTALLRRFRDEVSPGVRILHGACDPLSTPRPLGPLLDIAAMVGGALERLAHEAAPRHRLFSALVTELNREPPPTLAIVEDVHWGDEATLDLVRFLGRRLGSTHGLVVATYRDDEVGPAHPLQRVLGDLATSACVERMTVSPLSVESVHILAVGSSFDPIALHHQTGGNPFFLTEILASSAPGIPETVRDAVLARVARLSTAGRETLEAAAVIGSPIELWLLSAVVDASVEAIDDCLASGMLRVQGDDIAFRHELARSAVLEAISPPRKIMLHRPILELLQKATAANPARLAHHAEEAGDRVAVLTSAPMAAERAAALGAHREAASQYRRALRFAQDVPLAHRGHLLEAYAYECYLTDHVTEGIVACQEALDIWREIGDRLREGEALRRLSRLFWLAGRREDAERSGWDAVAVLEALPPGPRLAMAYSNVSQLFLLAWHTDMAIPWGNKAIALAEQLGEVETLVHALNNVGMARVSTGNEDGREHVARSLRLALAANLEEHAARAYGNLGLSLMVDFRFAAADRLLLEGIAYCAERDLDQQRFYMLAWHALSQFHQGHWSMAVVNAEEVLRQHHISPTSRIMALVALGRVLARRGDQEAPHILDEALSLASQTGELQRVGPVRVARAELAWLAGNDDCVVAEAEKTLEQVLEHNHLWLLGELAFWLWRVGRLDAATWGTRAVCVTDSRKVSASSCKLECARLPVRGGLGIRRCR